MKREERGDRNAEVDILTERFLSGETSLEEEHKLYAMLDGDDISSEQRALRSIMALSSTNHDIEAWLSEDETAAYDDIIRKHRHGRIIMRRTVAAVFICLVFIAGMKFGQHLTKPETETGRAQIAAKSVYPDTATGTITAQDGAQAAKTDTQEGGKHSPALASAGIKQAPAGSPSRQAKRHTEDRRRPAMTAETADGSAEDACLTAMNSMDSIRHIINNVEQEMQNVSDSVYIARTKQLIETDAHLQRLVYKVMVRELKNDSRELEATNGIY